MGEIEIPLARQTNLNITDYVFNHQIFAGESFPCVNSQDGSESIKYMYIPSDETVLLLAKSALFATNITAFCAIFSDVHSACNILSATRKLLLSADE